MTKKFNQTKSERFEATEQKVKNLEMSQRVAQMLIQQIGNSVSPMAKDVGELAVRQRELQYQMLAMRDLLNLNLEDINARAEILQVKDFNEASDKEDTEKGYTVAQTVTEDSIVILSSKTSAGTGGILRSKLIVKDIGFPQLRSDLLGKTVGGELTADINGVVHTITVLGIRDVPPPTEPAVQLVPELQEDSSDVENATV